MKTVEQDLYDLLKNAPLLAGVEVSYGESFLEDEADELVNIIVSACQLNGDKVSGDIQKFSEITGEYDISIFITAGNYLRARELLHHVGNTLIQQPSGHTYYFQSYSVDADSYVNHVQIELSIITQINFYHRA